MQYTFNDGGRKNAGFKGLAGDCVARSIAIVSGHPYQEIYTDLSTLSGNQRLSKGQKPIKSARNGIFTKRVWFKRYMHSLGFVWHPTMEIGKGCQVHLNSTELPTGSLIVAVSRHYTAVLDHVIHDTHNPSREGTRCVYGYWAREN